MSTSIVRTSEPILRGGHPQTLETGAVRPWNPSLVEISEDDATASGFVDAPMEEERPVPEAAPRAVKAVFQPTPRTRASHDLPGHKGQPRFPFHPGLEDPTGPSVLVFRTGQQEPVVVTKSAFVIGRDEQCDFVVRNRGISREHAVLTREKGGWYIEDLHSANGTWINNRPITKVRIRTRQEITLANLVFYFDLRKA